MNIAENAKAVCPYYESCEKNKIKCAKVIPESRITTIEFTSKSKRIEYQENFCFCHCWRGCVIAQISEKLI